MFAAQRVARSMTTSMVMGNRQVVRALHVENKPGESVPFAHNNKGAFALKMVAFLGTGFFIPIFNAIVTLSK